MKYEKPKLIKLSDSSHHVVYGACVSGDGAASNTGQGQCGHGPTANAVNGCNAGGYN